MVLYSELLSLMVTKQVSKPMEMKLLLLVNTVFNHANIFMVIWIHVKTVWLFLFSCLYQCSLQMPFLYHLYTILLTDAELMDTEYRSCCNVSSKILIVNKDLYIYKMQVVG